MGIRPASTNEFATSHQCKAQNRSQNIFVELEFDNCQLPISFQMDTFYTHNGDPSSLSKAYIDYIQKFAAEAKAKNIKPIVDDLQSWIERFIL